MSLGRGEQIEHDLDQKYGSNTRGRVTHSHKEIKKLKHKRERRRAKKNPECPPEYNKYDGWEW